MAWRVAKSLNQLLEQINTAYPGRSRASDGSIGDAAHASRSSDHNPWYGPGIVTARDFTHDPGAGFDAHAFAERLRQARDPRIKYVISNGRIFSATVSPWTWRKYTGSNPHVKHVHVSVVADRRCDDTSPWRAVATEARVLGSRVVNIDPEPEDDMPDKATFEQWVANGLASAADTSKQFRNAIRDLIWHEHYGRGDRRATPLETLQAARADAAAALEVAKQVAARPANAAAIDPAELERIITDAADRVRIDVTVTPKED